MGSFCILTNNVFSSETKLKGTGAGEGDDGIGRYPFWLEEGGAKTSKAAS